LSFLEQPAQFVIAKELNIIKTNNEVTIFCILETFFIFAPYQ